MASISDKSMASVSILISALLAALCTNTLVAAPLSDDEAAAMLGAHNAVRQQVARAESQRLGGIVSSAFLTSPGTRPWPQLPKSGPIF